MAIKSKIAIKGYKTIELKDCQMIKPNSIFNQWKYNIGKKKIYIKDGYSNYKIVRNINTELKLIFINKLKLPDVLIDIIKDYLYCTQDMILHKHLQSSVNSSITHDIYKEGEYMVGKKDNHIYEYQIRNYIEGPLRYDNGIRIRWSHCLIMYICSQCGNYTNDDFYEDPYCSRNLLCICENHPYNQIQNEYQTFYTRNITNSEMKLKY
jgi:hypothetical protein